VTTTNHNLEYELKKLYAQVPPPPGNLAVGRERLLAEAAQLRIQVTPLAVPVGHAAEIRRPRRRRRTRLLLAYKIIATVLAIAIGAAVTGGGVALASADNLPGDALYPVKLFVEDIRLALTTDPTAKAELNLTLATERAEEMHRLVAHSAPVPAAPIERMAWHTRAAMTYIAQAQPEEIPWLLLQVMERTRTQQRVLEQVGEGVPEEAQAVWRHAQEEAKRAYETASAAQGDPKRFLYEYQRRYGDISGPQDSEGPYGPPDDAGPQGPQDGEGPYGPPDDAGPQDPQDGEGPYGPPDDAGPQGPQDGEGPHGPQDDTGPLGPQDGEGPHGPQYDPGPQDGEGPHGPQDDAGPLGPQDGEGPHGPQDDAGPLGPQDGEGPQDDAGPPGPQDGEGPHEPQDDPAPPGPQDGEGPQEPQDNAAPPSPQDGEGPREPQDDPAPPGPQDGNDSQGTQDADSPSDTSAGRPKR